MKNIVLQRTTTHSFLSFPSMRVVVSGFHLWMYCLITACVWNYNSSYSGDASCKWILGGSSNNRQIYEICKYLLPNPHT